MVKLAHGRLSVYHPLVSQASRPASTAGDIIAVAWTASDATSGVSETRLWVRFADSAWTDTSLWAAGASGTFTYAPIHGDGAYYFATRSVDVAGNWEALPTGPGDAHTWQDTAPLKSQATSPATSSTPTFTVSWSGTDAGSGIAAYDVQVQIDGGAWQDWQVGVTFTSAEYTGAWGHRYGFRCRARDAAGNWEAYPDSADTVTTLVALVRKYYYAAGRRVAKREGPHGTPGVLYYLHTDHLGSTSLLTDANGQRVDGSALHYLPYGSVRYGNPAALPTAYNFTGQRLDSSTNLLYYGARPQV